MKAYTELGLWLHGELAKRNITASAFAEKLEIKLPYLSVVMHDALRPSTAEKWRSKFECALNEMGVSESE